MADKLKEIPGKILEWWGRFTNKQKTIIVGIAAVVIFTFAIIVYAFTRPQYTLLKTFDNNTEAAEVINILNDAGITHRESDDAKTIEVLSGQISQANYAMAAAGYVPDGVSLGDYLQGGMSTTSWEMRKQYEVYAGDRMAQMFKALNFVRDVDVIVNLAEDTGTLWAQQMQEESSATIRLTLSDTCTQADAAAIAKAAATILGNSTTANITILDSDSNLLFAGGDDYSSAGIANSVQELQNQATAMVANQVKNVLYGTNQYNLIEVASYLKVDYATYENKIKEHYTNDNMSQGVLDWETNLDASSTNGVGGVPGTDSNGGDLTGYVNPDYNSSETAQTEYERHYLPNIKESYETIPAGVVDFAASSMSISMITYREYHEENVRAQGLLDGGLTWEQFKEANREDVRLAVDEEFYQMAAMATGINRENIVIIAYESPMFFDREGLQISATDILSIVMIVLILALLGFVVLRSMAGRKEPQEEEELSVETMLQSTPESTIEDIDVEAKSETRKLIEKFVDENPEAAANLLRNWLNEDWG